MVIGKIVKSNSHIDYLCRINDKLETEEPPDISAYTFGRFVRISAPINQRASSPSHIVGVIYNSELVNPEFGSYGPRLTTPPDQNAVFSPDYVNEQFTLVGILLLGWMDGSVGTHKIPPEIVPLNIEVSTLSDEDTRMFHIDQSQEFHLNYYSHLLLHAGRFGPQLVQTILDQLNRLFDNRYAAMLAILRDTLSWQMTMTALK
ncbi:MAG: hypothetical protein B6244_00900 [Candidatus Cloacimonetes bacterium 4572_55]|nr:MAG: hypothetical protein B6244_00900 [Candidatus Cloacimonetes bacterium 4572_55]